MDPSSIMTSKRTNISIIWIAWFDRTSKWKHYNTVDDIDNQPLDHLLHLQYYCRMYKCKKHSWQDGLTIDRTRTTRRRPLTRRKEIGSQTSTRNCKDVNLLTMPLELLRRLKEMNWRLLSWDSLPLSSAGALSPPSKRTVSCESSAASKARICSATSCTTRYISSWFSLLAAANAATIGEEEKRDICSSKCQQTLVQVDNDVCRAFYGSGRSVTETLLQWWREDQLANAYILSL